MKVFVENIPSFYRTEHINNIAKKKDVSVIYTEAMEKESTRNEDFFRGDFCYGTLFLKGSLIKKARQIHSFLKAKDIEEIIICGWSYRAFWLIAFMYPKKLNSCVVESSIYESPVKGPKALLKKIFLSRISKVYAAGKAQEKLLKALNFKGQIVISGGCGLLNYQKQPLYEERKSVKRFLFVGRLIELKNIKMLISVFNNLPQLELDIAGFGEQEEELKGMAGPNIIFMGAINNQDLWKLYREVDVFILPSKSEPWGLVVEEALNNGTPVIVSNKVGCRDDLVTSTTGLVFNYNDYKDLERVIKQMCNVEFYNKLRLGVSKLNFDERAKHQIEVFI